MENLVLKKIFMHKETVLLVRGSPFLGGPAHLFFMPFFAKAH
jgi:hypothetical protein